MPCGLPIGSEGTIEASTMNCVRRPSQVSIRVRAKGVGDGTHEVVGIEHLGVLVDDSGGRARADLGGADPVVGVHGRLRVGRAFMVSGGLPPWV